jgi:hypothetical protein
LLIANAWDASSALAAKQADIRHWVRPAPLLPRC